MTKRFPAGLAIFEIAMVLFACAIFCVLAGKYFDKGFFDDSYITLRYARNLARGHGFVWNIGEAPVEGFTNIGWIGLLSIFRQSDPIRLGILARKLGIVAGVGTLIVFWLATRVCLPKGLRLLSLATLWHLALFPYYSRHAVSAMETIPTCLAIGAICLLLAFSENNSSRLKWWIALAILTCISGLLRPDATLFGVAGAAAVLFHRARRAEPFIKPAVVYAIVFGSLVALFLLWKLSYFGSIIPLPAYMKARVSWMTNIHLINFMLGHWLSFVRVSSPLILIILIAKTLGFRFAVGPFAITFASVVYGAYFLSVLPVMSVNLRYLVPIYGPLVLIAVLGMGSMAELSRKIATNNLRYKLAACLAAIFFVVYNIGDFPLIREDSHSMIDGYEKSYGRIGVALADVHPLSVALSEVGLLPYFSDCRTLDTSGLNDRFIATRRFKSGDMNREFRSYVENTFGLPDIYIRPAGVEYGYALPENQPEMIAHYDKFDVMGVSLYVLKTSPRRQMIVDRLSALPH